MTRWMSYALRLLPLAALAAIIALASSGLIARQVALIVSVGAEALILLAAALLAIPAWRRAKASRANGASGWQALESALTVFVPQPVARLLVMEPRLWACIGAWLRRRPRQSGGFTYHQGSLVGALAFAALFSAPVEILLGELLIPWSWLRIVLLISSIYAAIWMLGFAASLATLPHRLERDGLRLRYGLLAEAYIPYAAIVSATRERRSPRSGREGVSVDEKASAAYLSIGGQTVVTLDLREPATFQRLFASTQPVRRVYLAVDDARGFVATLAERLEASRSPEPAALVSQS